MKALQILLATIFLTTSIGTLAQGAGVPTVPADWCKRGPRAEYASLKKVASGDPWFDVYEIRPGVFAIYEPRQGEEVISYLIVGSKRAVLFDTGLGIGNIQRVAEGWTKLPITVVNSHTHNDHVGDNWRFHEVAGMDTDFTRQNAKGSRDDAQAELGPGLVCGALPSGFDAKAYATRPWKITQTIHDGSTFDLGGRTLEVIATPGHTPDAIALIDRGNRLLFTGDSYYPGPIFLYRPETDVAAYENSMTKLAALASQVDLLLPAHNVPVADPKVLAKVVTAFRQVRAGQKKPAASDGNYLYEFDGFSFLMSKTF